MPAPLRNILTQRQRAIADVEARADRAVVAAIEGFAAAHGKQAAAGLVADLQSSDPATVQRARDVLVGRVEGLADLQAAHSQAVEDHRPVFSEAFVKGADARGTLTGKHGDLVGALAETQREFVLDRIAADAVLDGSDPVGALALATTEALSPNDPRWQAAFDHALAQEAPVEDVATWSAEKAEAWLVHNTPAPQPAATVIVGADGKTSSDAPSVEAMLRDIERLDREQAERRPKTDPKDEYRKFFETT